MQTINKRVLSDEAKKNWYKADYRKSILWVKKHDANRNRKILQYAKI